MLSELGQDNREWGDKFKTHAIINIAMVGGLNKSYGNSSLLVQPPIGIPQFQVQEHSMKTITNTIAKGGIHLTKNDTKGKEQHHQKH